MHTHIFVLPLQSQGEDVAGYMNLAHFGVISYIANPMTELTMPNKVFKYIALDVPIISCRLKGLHPLIGNDSAPYPSFP